MIYLSLLILVAVVADFVFVAFFRRLKRAKFCVTSDTPSSYVFRSDIGEFRIDRNSRTFHFATTGERGSVSLVEIDKMKFSYASNFALLQELFFGLDLMDLFPAYRDTDHWYTIQVLTKSGKAIPVFTAGQYQPREFLLTWYITLQERILEKLGIFTDVHDYSRLILEELLEAFTDSGRQIRMV